MATLYRLTQEQRLEARRQAIEAVQLLAGERPRRADYADTHISKYPDWLIRSVVALCAGLLVVMFIPSSIRLWHIGSETFGEGANLNSKTAMVLVGYCVVLMAEITVVLFTLAWAVLELKRGTRLILAFSIVAGVSIALVGNIEIGLVRAGSVTAFTYLETILPPLLTLSTSFVLKEVALDKIKHRHADNTTYNAVLQEWEAVFNQPERHVEWGQLFANALRDKIREVNGRNRGATERLEVLNALSSEEWSRLVRREMQADEWYQQDVADSVQGDVQSIVQGVQSARSTAILNTPQPGFNSANALHEQGFSVQPTVQNQGVAVTLSDAEHPFGFAGMAATPSDKSKVDQVAEILLANLSEFRGMSYTQILNDPRINASRGTLSAAVNKHGIDLSREE